MPYVDSTLVSWVDYDPETRTLAVRFRAAPVLYSHVGVPAEVYDAFLAAESKNSFYQEKIARVFRLEAPPLSRAGDGAIALGGTGTDGA